MDQKEYDLIEELVDYIMPEDDARFLQNLLRENREPLEQEDHDRLIELYEREIGYGREPG